MNFSAFLRGGRSLYKLLSIGKKYLGWGFGAHLWRDVLKVAINHLWPLFPVVTNCSCNHLRIHYSMLQIQHFLLLFYSDFFFTFRWWGLLYRDHQKFKLHCFRRFYTAYQFQYATARLEHNISRLHTFQIVIVFLDSWIDLILFHAFKEVRITQASYVLFHDPWVAFILSNDNKWWLFINRHLIFTYLNMKTDFVDRGFVLAIIQTIKWF